MLYFFTLMSFINTFWNVTTTSLKIGILGKYGNTVKSKIKVGKWHRVVISVKCVEMKSDDAIGPKGRGRSKPGRSRGMSKPKKKKEMK